jgi:hypothetical protein
MGKNLPPAWLNLFGVDGDHNALAAELFRSLSHQVWAGDRSGVDAAFVSAGEQQPAHVRNGSYPAADRER